MNLLDILACPACHAAVVRDADLGRWFGRPRTVRVPYGWSRRGAIGMLRRRTEALLRWVGLLPARRRIIGR